VTPLYPQKLVLTSPTGGGRSVGIVRVRTKATEFRKVNAYRIIVWKHHTEDLHVGGRIILKGALKK